MKINLNLLQTIIIIIILNLYYIPNIKANDYKNAIDNLQKQIDELKAKNNSYNNNNFLNDIKINGRLHINNSFYDNSNNDDNKFSIRRARISISKAIDNFTFNFENNFSQNKSSLASSYISYSKNNHTIKIGQMITPGFIENEKSSNSMAVIDLSAFNFWMPAYLIGLNYNYYSEINKIGVSTGYFGNSVAEEIEISNNNQKMRNALFLRSFYTPIINNDIILHLGFDFMHQNLQDRNITNYTNIKNNVLVGFEFAFQYKNITFITEYAKLFNKYNEKINNKNNYNFDGFYSEFVYTFTKEPRRYSKVYGYFDNITVANPLSKGGFGAFEGVFSYSYNDGKDDVQHYFMSSKSDYTFGLNWLPEDGLKILLAYSFNRFAENIGKIDHFQTFKLEVRMFF